LFRANTSRRGAEDWRVAYGVLALYMVLLGGFFWFGFRSFALFIHTFAADPRVHTFGESNVLS
jgi:hypothetical protein